MPLPVMPMFLPGCSFRAVSAARTSPLIRVEFCQSSEVRVLETTYFGVSFMWSASSTSLPCCGQ